MALPTASTYGYGYYPTLGPTPDVACNCLRTWLPVFKRMLRHKGLGEIAVWQCTGALDASNGVHSQGGAFDIGGISTARAMVAREMGAPATWPRNWTGNQHTHGVLSGCPHNGPAAYQITAQWLGRDGTGYRGLAHPDPLPRPSRYRTWREGIAWAESQMTGTTGGTTTTTQELTMADAASLEAQLKALATLIAKYDANNQARANAIAADVDALSERVDKVDEAVWQTDVQRDGGPVDTIQELADIKTMLLDIKAKLDG